MIAKILPLALISVLASPHLVAQELSPLQLESDLMSGALRFENNDSLILDKAGQIYGFKGGVNSNGHTVYNMIYNQDDILTPKFNCSVLSDVVGVDCSQPGPRFESLQSI